MMYLKLKGCTMNNKKLGTAFEGELCQLLKKAGFWVHFITPNASGAQPFDIIAVKKGKAYAIDCKTSAKPTFSRSRLELNQIMAFALWQAKGNIEPIIAVKYQNTIYFVPYSKLDDDTSVQLNEIKWRIEL